MKEFTKNEKLITLLSSIAILLIIGGYAANKMTNENSSVATKSPITPVENPQTTAETTPATPENTTDKYADSMEKYKAMSVDDFEKLPLDERLLYSQYLVDKSVSSGAYDKMYKEGEKSHDYKVEYVPVSKNNNGQEIVNDNLFMNQISALQSYPYVAEVNGHNTTYNAIDGDKILSSVYYNVGKNHPVSKSYLGVKGVNDSMDMPTYQASKYTATNTSEILKGHDNNGNSIEYKVVTYYNSSAQTLYAKYIYHEFTSYDGTRQALWLFDNQSADKTEIN